MKYILGEKIGMTQVYNDKGNAFPATVIKTNPGTITQIKTLEKDGYTSIQLGTGKANAKKMKKPVVGHLKKTGNFKKLKEARFSESDISQYQIGDKIDLHNFTEGDKVSVRAVSKAKGFQGVVKRHGFHGGPRSHGQKHSEREPGSIGGGGRAGGRVVKGMKMAGRMGGRMTNVKNLIVVGLDTEENYIFIKGAVPGRRGTLVEIIGK